MEQPRTSRKAQRKVTIAWEYELKTVQRNIQRFLELAEEQKTRIERLRNMCAAENILDTAERMLRNIQTSLTIMHMQRMMLLRWIHRDLSVKLLQEEARRGALLSRVEANRRPMVLKRLQISPIAAESCIRLHTEWREFMKAEQWSANSMRPSPNTAVEAMHLLDCWHRLGGPTDDMTGRQLA